MHLDVRGIPANQYFNWWSWRQGNRRYDLVRQSVPYITPAYTRLQKPREYTLVMDNTSSCTPSHHRLPPIATTSTWVPKRLPSIQDLRTQFCPYLRPPINRSKTYSSRPSSRDQASAAGLTPSSLLTYSYCIGTEHFAVGPAQNNVEYDTMTGAMEKNRRKSDPSPHISQSTAGQGKSEPVMLSPPQSPPSPRLPLINPERGPPTSYPNHSESPSDPSPVDINSCKTVEDYVQGLKTDALEEPRLAEIIHLIWQRFGVRIEPLSLKLQVLHNQRESLLADWGHDFQAMQNDDSIGAYQKRLMLKDIDNQVRILRVPP